MPLGHMHNEGHLSFMSNTSWRNEWTHYSFTHPTLHHSSLISPATSLSDTVNSFCALSNQSLIQMQGPFFFNEPFLCKMNWLLSNSSNPPVFWGRTKLPVFIWEINKSWHIFFLFSLTFGKFQHNKFSILRTCHLS